MYPECIVKKDTYQSYPFFGKIHVFPMMANVKIQMYLDESRCILMYMNGTHQDTCKIHSGYMKIHLGYVSDRKLYPKTIGNCTLPIMLCDSPASANPVARARRAVWSFFIELDATD